MKYKHMVKFDGKFYPAGTDVPVDGEKANDKIDMKNAEGDVSDEEPETKDEEKQTKQKKTAAK